jgi:hypothetical protein
MQLQVAKGRHVVAIAKLQAMKKELENLKEEYLHKVLNCSSV